MGDFWRGKKVLVTGGAGFLGYQIRESLNATSAPSILCTTHTTDDLTNKDRVHSLLKHVKPSIVIHCAAVAGGIGFNQEHPAEIFYQNAQMGIHIIDACHRFNVQKLVVIGTACEYPCNAPLPLKEVDLWTNGYLEEVNSYYAYVKKMLMIQQMAYYKQYKFPSVHVVLTNLYGPDDKTDPSKSKSIMAIIKKVVDAKREGVPQVGFWGSPNATRDYLHVKDAAEGILKLAENEIVPIGHNLGSGVEVSISTVVQQVANIVGYTGKIVWSTRALTGQEKRVLDLSRTKFVPKIGLQAGLKETIAWYEGQQ